MIKSFPNGLKVFLDRDEQFDVLVRELSSKIADSKGFFKGSRIAISFEDRKLSAEEEKILVETMETAGDMTILYVLGTDNEMNENVARVVSRSMNDDTDGKGCFGKLYTGSLHKGERLEAESGIVLLGDVEPGAVLTAHGSIVVIGGIYGTCICEVEDNEHRYFIAASNLSPERIKIGGCYVTPREKPRWVIRPRMQSRICYCEGDAIVMEPVSPDSLKKLCELIGQE